MKKYLVTLMMIALVSGLIFSGCAAQAPAPASAPPPAQKPGGSFLLKVDGGPPGSSKNFEEEAKAEAIRMGNPNWRVQVISGLPASARYDMMIKGQMDAQVLRLPDILEIKKGTVMGQKIAAPLELAWVMSDSNRCFPLTALERVPFNSFPELVQKKYPIKLGLGTRGSPTVVTAIDTLAAYGVTIKDILSWGGEVNYGGTGEFLDWMGDEIIEGYLYTVTEPSPTVRQLLMTKKLKYVTVTEPEIFAKLKPLGYDKGIVPARTHPFINKDLTTLQESWLFAVRRDMPDETAYNIARAIWENLDFLYKAGETLKTKISKELVQERYSQVGELIHPGAKKYFMEKGIIK